MKTRKIIRMRNFNYAAANFFFITICSYQKELLFGNIQDGKLNNTVIGEEIKRCWEAINDLYENVSAESSVIMPNHIHGIIHISEDKGISIVDVIHNLKSYTTHQYQSLKTGVLLWQRGYYEHIIRDNAELVKIQNNIENNVTNWVKDKFYIPS